MLIEPRASSTVECITSGAIMPATMPLAVEPTTACSDEARPRRSGWMSSTSSVTTGTIMAQPKANTPTGISAQLTWAGQIRLATRLMMDTTNMIRKRSEEHTSELQSQSNLVCRLLLEKKKKHQHTCDP